jgi:hypothetical protein
MITVFGQRFRVILISNGADVSLDGSFCKERPGRRVLSRGVVNMVISVEGNVLGVSEQVRVVFEAKIGL